VRYEPRKHHEPVGFWEDSLEDIAAVPVEENCLSAEIGVPRLMRIVDRSEIAVYIGVHVYATLRARRVPVGVTAQERVLFQKARAQQAPHL
jgi:hypothetical protein